MTLLTKFRSWIGGTSPMQDLVDPEIEEYAAAHSVAESDVCRLIREEPYRTQDCPQMVVGPLEAAFLKVMALAVRARRVLEIGTFTGYSALAMAEALPEDGTVLTCENDPDSAAFARRYWDKRSEEHTSELQSPCNLVCRLLLEKKNRNQIYARARTGHTRPATRCS